MIYDDDATINWVVEAVPHLQNLWPNVKIKTIDEGLPPKLVKCSVMMTVPTLEPNDVITLIGAKQSN